MCDTEATGYHRLKNGQWTFEPVENFGIEDPDDGMVCVEWDSQYLHFYYHPPENPDPEPELPGKVPCSKSRSQQMNEEGLLVDGVTVSCNRCGESKFSFGTTERSTKRCLALLSENCPKDQNNFYEVQ